MDLSKKGLGFYTAIATAVFAVIGLIMYLVYTGQGGIMDAKVIVATILAIACCATQLLGEQVYTDFTAVGAAVLLAWAMVLTLQTGIGNIADQVNGIVMFGNAELANMNYYMAIVYGLGVVAAVVTCFMKKEK